MEYVVIEVNDGRQYVVASSRLEHFKAEIGLENVEVKQQGLTGKDLLRFQYRHPLSGTVGPVLSADFVTDDTGTGIVHLAPGHGFDDYQLCKEHSIEPFCPGKSRSHIF
jgi:isoleucyl-tRNA synthetase